MNRAPSAPHAQAEHPVTAGQDAAVGTAAGPAQAIDVQAVEQFLRNGCSDASEGIRLGFEIEHFIVDPATKQSVTYYGEAGIEALLRRLIGRIAPAPEDVVWSEGHILGFSVPDYAITLEPAAQLEISVRPVRDVFTFRGIYDGFRAELDPVLADMGYGIVTQGYQPASKTADLPLIPKERYRLMDAHFAQIGESGRHMMRGTASTQVSIDYFSEEDFKCKYRLAYRLREALADLTDNVPVFEGEPNTLPRRRLEIWKGVDPVRDDVAPFMKGGTIDFASYARFVAQAPAIVPAHGEPEVEHAMSMVFPDIRAKHYLEIRVGDSMPADAVMAYGIVIRNLFADAERTQAFMHGWLAGTHVMEYVTAVCDPEERAFLTDLYGDDPASVQNLVRDRK